MSGNSPSPALRISDINTEEISNSNYNSSGDQSVEMVSLKKTSDSKIQIQLVWEKIECTVKTKKGSESILKGVSGYSNPGEILAIMGSSGAGKTTLISILAGQIASISGSHISGKITANGNDIRKISYRSHCAYVTQEDTLLSTLTARESLMFSSRLRCPGTLEEHKNRVNKILDDLRLDNIADNVIGSVVKKGVSGGERRRICIGIELITEPSILILDEPTSGLDSYTADIVFTLLVEQSQKGRNIISTVHQPSSMIFNKFDRLILMSEGQFVYQGGAKKSRKYFAALGYKCPRHVLPSDYYMKIMHVVNRYEQTEEEKETLKILIESYESQDSTSGQKTLETVNYDYDLNEKPHKIGFFERLLILFKRASKNARRNVIFSRVKFIQAIGISILFVLIFNDLGTGATAIQNRNGILFMLSLTAFTLGSQNELLCFPSERPLFLKESGQGLYDSFSYFIAKSLTELPNLVIAVLLECLIVYWAVGLNNHDASKFFIFYAIMLLFNMCGNSFGLFTGSLFKSQSGAMAGGPLITIPFVIFGGSFANLNSLPAAFSWIQYISPYKYGYEALSINEYTDLNLYCQTCDPATDKGCIPCDPLGQQGFEDSLGIAILAIILEGWGMWMITSLILFRLSWQAKKQ
ncbi:unnamed protein product [Blepharisma stoltei]|uniref:ABC transporter domain-containing protein n=1 Tax=Blepharisma stoltei TaxID=1481888 RepID=A0AAU9JS08_9CILI|nr:unnamed protein product [Blepharisma stoltei]